MSQESSRGNSSFSSPSTFLLFQNKYFHFKQCKMETKQQHKGTWFFQETQITALWRNYSLCHLHSDIQTLRHSHCHSNLKCWPRFSFHWILLWGSKIRLYNHLEIHGSRLAWDPAEKRKQPSFDITHFQVYKSCMAALGENVWLFAQACTA